MGGALTVRIRKRPLRTNMTGTDYCFRRRYYMYMYPTLGWGYFFPLQFSPIIKFYWHVTHVEKRMYLKQTARWIFTSWKFLCKHPDQETNWRCLPLLCLPSPSAYAALVSNSEDEFYLFCVLSKWIPQHILILRLAIFAQPVIF